MPPGSATLEDAGETLAGRRGGSRRGFECEQIVCETDRANRIIGAAKEIGADLIVMGRHVRSGTARFFLASVAEAVVRQAHCPVLTLAHRAELEMLPFAPAAEESEAVSTS